MQKSQKGFTLVELIVVIVLLGILGVTALGKFQDLSGDAERAAVNAIAAEITSSSNINYAKSLLNPGQQEVIIGDTSAGIEVDVSAEACNDPDIADLLNGGAIPQVNNKAVALTTDTSACAAIGDQYSCAVTLGGAALVPPVSVTLVCTNT